jgi:hypothetical protein
MRGNNMKVELGMPTANIRMPVTSKTQRAWIYAPDGKTPLQGDPAGWERRKDGQLMARTHLDKCPGKRRRR